MKIRNTTYSQEQSSLVNSITHKVSLNHKYYKLNNQQDNQKTNQIPGIDNLSYTLNKTATTSAGVFDGDVLIRTLWNNEKRSAGTYDLSTAWDGKDDNGSYVTDKNYIIKVVSNNVTYEWLRPIGNTSDSASGPTVHHSFCQYTNMVQVGNQMYCANGYNEVGDTHSKFTIGQPNTLTTTRKSGCMVARFVASDGARIYYSGQGRGDISFTTALTPNPGGVDGLYSFSNGRQIQIPGNNDYAYSAIDYDSVANFPTGMTVQQTGNYLFTSHAISGELRVLNKLTGALIRSNSFTGIRHLAMQDDNTMWLSSYSPHTGTTISSKVSGTIANSDAVSGSPASAFDGVDGTYFRSTGGLASFIGYSFSGRRVITQVRVKPLAGTTITGAKIIASDGYEDTVLGTVTATDGTFTTINVSNGKPYSYIKIDGHDLPPMYIDELEVYGYTYSGVVTISKRPVNSDGTLGSAILTLSGVTDPLALAVSPDQTKISVANRGNYDQVKIFSTSTGGILQTIGRAENYTNPRVYNDKFYFNNGGQFRENDYGHTTAFLAYQSDGSVWIGDYSNKRCQHFAPDGSYIDNIQTAGSTYNAQVDINKPTRLFSDYLEFSIDYTTNAWTFVRNWARTTVNPEDYDEGRMRSVATLSNGRTYALSTDMVGGPMEVIELNTMSGLRYTGVHLDNFFCDLDSDGSVWQVPDHRTAGEPVVWKRKPLTGFDSNNNPQWGSYVNMEMLPAFADGDPFNSYIRRNAKTSTGIIASFIPDKTTGWHLGGLKNGAWRFKTSPPTRSDYATRNSYSGNYPDDGAFDIGNYVENAGSTIQTVDRNIFWGYKGEFWKPNIANQVNKYHHYLDNGLLIGIFGISGDVAKGLGEAAPGMAGNATSGTYVKVGNDIHFFHADEGQHAGMHHWKISNLSSITEQSVTIIKSGSLPLATLPYVDLMTGVPLLGAVTMPVGRWSVSPAFSSGANSWTATAGSTVYKRTDRCLQFSTNPSSSTTTQEAYCDLKLVNGVTNSLSSWTIVGTLTYPNVAQKGDNFLEVLDHTGKVIVRIYRTESFPNQAIKVNSATLLSGQSVLINQLYLVGQTLRISRSGSSVTVNYGPYSATVSALDTGANLTSPDKLRVHYYGNEQVIDLANLKLYSTSIVEVGTGTGLTGQYFNNRSLSEPSVAQRTDPTINFNWGLGSPLPGQLNVDNFSVRWSGQVQAPVSGTYVFSTNSDDGVRLWLNGVQMIDNWTAHSLTTANSASIALTAGQKYDIKLEYYEGEQGAVAQLIWTYPNQGRQVIPQNRLYPTISTAAISSGVYLSDLTWTSATNGYGPVERDRSNGEYSSSDGRTITLNGVTYTKGLGAHALSEIFYNLGGKYTRFLSDVGIDDERSDNASGSVRFRVYVDNILAYDSGILTATSATKSINLDVTNKQTLKLVIDPNGNNEGDHGDWAGARVVPAGSARVSVVEQEDIDITTKVYPVPVQDVLLIQYHAKEAGDLSIKLVNVTAQPVFESVYQVTQGENTLSIPTKEFTRGVYLLHLIQGYKRVSQRVILSDQ